MEESSGVHGVWVVNERFGVGGVRVAEESSGIPAV